MKKNIIILVLVLIIALLGVLSFRFWPGGDEDTWVCSSGEWVMHGRPTSPKPETKCNFTVRKISSFSDCVRAGLPVNESYPRKCSDSQGNVYTEDINNASLSGYLIRVETPRPNEAIGTPLTIFGEARGFWFFEASFPIKLYDAENNLLATAIAQAEGEWMTENFVKFKSQMEFVLPKDENGYLVLEKDNPSGLPENYDELKIPISFKKELTSLKVFFATPKTGAEPNFDCAELGFVTREVPKTEAVGRAALEELLRGPTDEEIEAGFSTGISKGVKIKDLSIVDGVAKVDFDEQIEYQTGGSCRVTSIRAQITQTLKQFPTVKEVVISVDGRVDDILQP